MTPEKEEWNLSDKIFDIDNWNKGVLDKDVSEFIRRCKERKIWVHHKETHQECYCITIEDLNKLAGEKFK